MVIINIHDAKTNLSKYLALVEQGEKVVICRRNIQIAEIIPKQKPSRKRTFKPYKKDLKFHLKDNFKDPLPNEIADAFGVTP